MEKVFVFNHPLMHHKLSILRDKNTKTKQFRELVTEITSLMTYEIMKDLPLQEVEIETPVAKMTAQKLSEQPIVLIPILRAGLGMVDGIWSQVPSAKVGHIGMARDEETLQPKEYYRNLPVDTEKSRVFVLDPMLATGGSAAAAIAYLKSYGIKHIEFVCMVASPEGIAHLTSEHPDVQIYAATVDEKLNENGYIVPGLGDAGDRLYGTK